MVWLFVQLPPLSEFHFFNTNTKPKSENIISVPIQHLPQVGYDKSLKKAKVFIDVLDDRFTWKLRETVTGVLTYNGKIVDLEQYFSNQNYIEKINQAVDIVCLGNASFEEEENVSVEYRTKFEETRALIRANYLKGLIKSFLKFNNYSTQIYTLNLGKCIDIVKVSNYQRTIVIIRIIEKDEGVILEEALLDALLKEPKMPFKVERYSLVQDKKLDLEIK